MTKTKAKLETWRLDLPSEVVTSAGNEKLKIIKLKKCYKLQTTKI